MSVVGEVPHKFRDHHSIPRLPCFHALASSRISVSSCVHHPPSLFSFSTAVLFLPYLFVPCDLINAYPPIFSMFRKPYKPQEPALSNHTNTYNLYNVSFLHMCYHESSLFLFFAAVSLDLCASSFLYNSRILVILVTPLRFSTEMIFEA